MNNYTEIRFELPDNNNDEWIFDIVSSRLSDLGYEGFVEEGNTFSAFIPDKIFDVEPLNEILRELHEQFRIQLKFVSNSLPEKNWNQEWEKNFPSIVIADQCYIRAPFHPAIPEMKYELVIEPKMSFGTAHHETTQLMIEFMLEMDFAGKQVVDMGTGTGILAIMAQKLGAEKILAIDNDEWSFINAQENVSRNQANRISVIHGDAAALSGTGIFDIILANITRNILINDIPTYLNHLKPSGFLLLSGFYKEDILLFEDKSVKWKLKFIGKKEKNAWVSLLFQRV